MKVAVLGPRGTYTHEAADTYFESYEPVFYQSIQDIFDAEEEVAVVPFENSLGGSVSEVIDFLYQNEREITGEVKLRINHCLVSKEDSISEIDTVRSHPQALSQCREFINSKGFDEQESSSTAKAAEEIEPGEAALSSRVVAENSELKILEEGIQDSHSNVTRFVVLNGEDEPGEKTSVVISPGEDHPGLLHSMLGCFAGHGINLSYIQSRPTKNRLGEYYFYVDANAKKNSERFQKARKCLETYAEVDVLGSYPEDELE